MNKHVIALLVATNSIACAQSTVPRAFLPEGFNDDEISMMQDAATQWGAKTNGKCKALITEACDDDTCSVIKNEAPDQDSNIPGYVVYGSCEAYTISYDVSTQHPCTAVHDADHYLIKLSSSLGDKFARVFLHELGHTFMAQHLDRGNVMSTTFYDDNPSELTDEDIADAKCD